MPANIVMAPQNGHANSQTSAQASAIAGKIDSPLDLINQLRQEEAAFARRASQMLREAAETYEEKYTNLAKEGGSKRSGPRRPRAPNQKTTELMNAVYDCIARKPRALPQIAKAKDGVKNVSETQIRYAINKLEKTNKIRKTDGRFKVEGQRRGSPIYEAIPDSEKEEETAEQ